MRDAIAVVLGGGRTPHAAHQVSFQASRAACGQYRLIDIPLSNCLNSHLTAFTCSPVHVVSLHRHIRGMYRFDNFSGGFVEILAA
jgi:glucose-1-phosphate adenylyltransferase